MHPDYAARNRTAPDFELPKLGGGTAKLSSYRGKIVILNFWTKTCRPCLEEMPGIASLGKALAPHDDMALLTISTDDTRSDALSNAGLARSDCSENCSMPMYGERFVSSR